VLNVPRPEGTAAESLIGELRNWVGEQLSPIAKPDEIRLTDNLPKTRSGKIMRRLLRSIARGEEITQDVSTLENPGILEQLKGGPAAPAAATRATPAKRVAPAKRAASAKRAVQPTRATAGKKTAARRKAKKTGVAVKQSKQIARVKRGKRKVVRRKVVKRKGAKRKGAKRKVVAAKSRRAAVKAARRKPRGKK
jgi:hypothetical protein